MLFPVQLSGPALQSHNCAKGFSEQAPDVRALLLGKGPLPGRLQPNMNNLAGPLCGPAILRARSRPASKRTHGAFWLLHYAHVAHQRLFSRTTLDPADPARFLPLGGTALRKVGETFHCRPSSVTTVTVFLL